MGICHSGASGCVADTTTAKLILPDGGLQEFTYPIRVWHVLQSCDPACFICNSDDMDFDGAVSAVDGDDELRPGQLYFALPLNRLKRPLEAKEMAALAVKASLAMKGKGRGRKCGRALEAAFSGEKPLGGCSGGGVGGNGGSVKRPVGDGGRGRRRSVDILSEIPE